MGSRVKHEKRPLSINRGTVGRFGALKKRREAHSIRRSMIRNNIYSCKWNGARDRTESPKTPNFCDLSLSLSCHYNREGLQRTRIPHTSDLLLYLIAPSLTHIPPLAPL